MRTERDIAFVPLTAVSVPGAVGAVGVPSTVMLTVTVPQLEPGVNQIQIQTPSGNLEKKTLKNQQDLNWGFHSQYFPYIFAAMDPNGLLEILLDPKRTYSTNMDDLGVPSMTMEPPYGNMRSEDVGILVDRRYWSWYSTIVT